MKLLLYTVLVVVAGMGVAVLIGIAAILLWVAAGSVAERFKLGWDVVPVHYRLSFGVEVGGVAYNASTVVQVTYEQIPSWQVINGPGIAALYEGQAAYVKLPDGKAIFLLPMYLTPKFTDKRLYDAVELPNYLLSVNGSPSGPKKNGHQ
jgi:hypothetical protein